MPAKTDWLNGDIPNATALNALGTEINNRIAKQAGATIETTNIQTTIDSLNKFLNGALTIKLTANYTGAINPSYFIGGHLVIDLNGFVVTGSAWIEFCHYVTLKGGKIIDNRATGQWSGTITGTHGTTLTTENMLVDTNGKSSVSVLVRQQSNGYIRTTDVIRSTSQGIGVDDASRLNVRDCKGNAVYGVVSTSGCLASVTGTYPLGSTLSLHPTNGGQIFGTGTPTASAQT